MKYLQKSKMVRAVQWFKVGDHPEVALNTRHGRPDIIYQCCGHMGTEHGRLLKDGKTRDWIFCPGDWIVTAPNGEISVVKDSVFREMYEPCLFEIGVMPLEEKFEDYGTLLDGAGFMKLPATEIVSYIGVCTIRNYNEEHFWDIYKARHEQVKNWPLDTVYYSNGKESIGGMNPDVFYGRVEGNSKKECEDKIRLLINDKIREVLNGK